jgi:hypothetical protein
MVTVNAHKRNIHYIFGRFNNQEYYKQSVSIK